MDSPAEQYLEIELGRNLERARTAFLKQGVQPPEDAVMHR